MNPQYTIEKVLKHKHKKWAHVFHLELWTMGYAQNNGQE
jgi:hypothetical protein